MGNRMFPFITETWNPIGGRCPYCCIYCWSMGDKGLVKKYNMKKYNGVIRIYENELSRKFKNGDFIFVQDMSDLLADQVHNNYILDVVAVIRANPQAKFLLLTKNPKRYFDFLGSFPDNVVIGATIESDINFPAISKAPSQSDRLLHMSKLSINSDSLKNRYDLDKLFISIEPILDFTPNFIENIKYIAPWAVAVGYDNYNNKLPEPPLDKTLKFIEELEKNGIKVFRKTIRKAWYEK